MNLGKETEMLEFKTSTGELRQAMASVSAMLNKRGMGTLYFGVRPNGDVIGQDVSESSLRDVSRIIHESIKPEIYPSVEEVILDGKSVIRVDISGDRPPYSSSGRYYVRVADEDREMSPEELRAYFFADNNRAKWENALSEANADEVDEATVKSFVSAAIAKGRLPEGEYGITDILDRFGLARDGHLTNAGEHLFGSTKPIDAKCGVFATDEKLTILDMQLFEGNIFTLLKDCEFYIKRNIRWRAEITGLTRVDIPEIPEPVLREALANGFAHAYYGGRTTHEICIHPSFVSIYSPGAYASRFDPEEYIDGSVESDIRNPTIARILYLSGAIEEFGSGFKRIDSLSRDAAIHYSYEKRANGFKFIISRAANDSMDAFSGLNSTEASILALLRRNPSLSREEISIAVSKTVRTVQRNLDSLKEKGFIRRTGSKTQSKWEVLK